MDSGKALRVVVCELGEERYGLDIAAVFEIVRHQPITPVPGSPSSVEGIINLRGRIVPVIDLRSRFGMSRGSPTRASRIVVAETDGTRVGLVVDGVSEVLDVPEETVEPARTVRDTDGDAVRGIAKLDGHLVILLALDGLLAQAAA